MFKRTLSASLAIVLGALIVVALTGAANPKAPTPNPGPGVLFIPAFVSRTPMPVGTTVTAKDDRPVAQLDNAAADFKSMEVSLPGVYDPSPSYATYADAKSVEMSSSITYKSDDHVVIVTTALPGPEAYKPGWQLADEKVSLVNGTTAWYQDYHGATPKTPHSLAFERNGLIVTIFSDSLTETALKDLAMRVVLRS